MTRSGFERCSKNEQPTLAIENSLFVQRFLNGEAIKLEPRERKLLIALIDDLDHELDNDSLRDKVGSVAENFSPSKVFDRKPHVYRTFIRFLREDGRYQLQIPPEDRSWLI